MSYNQIQSINREAVDYAINNAQEIVTESVKVKPNRQIALLLIKLAHTVASWGIIQEEGIS